MSTTLANKKELLAFLKSKGVRGVSKKKRSELIKIANGVGGFIKVNSKQKGIAKNLNQHQQTVSQNITIVNEKPKRKYNKRPKENPPPSQPKFPTDYQIPFNYQQLSKLQTLEDNLRDSQNYKRDFDQLLERFKENNLPVREQLRPPSIRSQRDLQAQQLSAVAADNSTVSSRSKERTKSSRVTSQINKLPSGLTYEYKEGEMSLKKRNASDSLRKLRGAPIIASPKSSSLTSALPTGTPSSSSEYFMLSPNEKRSAALFSTSPSQFQTEAASSGVESNPDLRVEPSQLQSSSVGLDQQSGIQGNPELPTQKPIKKYLSYEDKQRIAARKQNAELTAKRNTEKAREKKEREEVIALESPNSKKRRLAFEAAERRPAPPPPPSPEAFSNISSKEKRPIKKEKQPMATMSSLLSNVQEIESSEGSRGNLRA